MMAKSAPYVVLLLGKHRCLVDATDVTQLAGMNWCSALMRVTPTTEYRYAYVKISGRRVLMHRFLLKPHRDLEIDHMNGDTMDNRRVNLRICTHQENIQNRKDAKNPPFGFLPQIEKGAPWSVGTLIMRLGLCKEMCLSDREYEVYQGLIKGTSIKSLADGIGVSANTASTYRARVLKKLGAQNTTDLVRLSAGLTASQ